MYPVTDEYVASMKQPLRNRTYMRVSIGLINQEAMNNATASAENLTAYGTNDIIGTDKTVLQYATNENGYTRVDGTAKIYPNTGPYVFTDGVVSDKVLGSSYTVRINLNIPATSIYGLTLDFEDADVYPTTFNVITSDGTVFKATNSTKIYTTEHVFADTTYLDLVFIEMGVSNTRVRIRSMILGLGLNYTNADIVGSTFKNVVSPIGKDVPQIDFSVDLKNYDGYFNVDNPKSAINFLESGQKISLSAGYDVANDGNIEWVKMGYLDCSSWKADSSKATISATDCLRSTVGQCWLGTRSSHTYYDLAVQVCTDAGLSLYYIDPYLKRLSTTVPLPYKSHKELLQIIANAARSSLYQDRDGKVVIQSNYLPTYSYSSTDKQPWSDMTKLNEATVKEEYGAYSPKYSVVDGSMKILPKSGAYTLTPGYVSNSVSKDDCTFSSNPSVTITLESALTIYNLHVLFGDAIASDFDVSIYLEGNLIETYSKTGNSSRDIVIHHTFTEFDTMVVTFKKTLYPHNRAVINSIGIEDTVSFDMQACDMTESPTTDKVELVKDIKVAYYGYGSGTETTELKTDASAELTAGTPVTYAFSDACYGYSVTVGGTAQTIDSSTAHAVTFTPTATQTADVKISGTKYQVSENYVTISLNPRGTDVVWKNPLIDSKDSALLLAEWLKDYYDNNVEYEYSTRGNPEIDPIDMIRQFDQFNDNLIVEVYSHTVKFDGGLSGSEKVRRVSHVVDNS